MEIKMAIKQNDKVTLDYEGKFEDGTVFDSSKNTGQPLVFNVGSGMVVKGFDNAVLGMEKGEEKEFSLNPEEAYGEHKPELKKDIPRNLLPPDQEPKEGMVLVMGTPDGNQIPAKIMGVDDSNVTVDLNHPLAGKKLTFKVKILDVKSSK